MHFPGFILRKLAGLHQWKTAESSKEKIIYGFCTEEAGKYFTAKLNWNQIEMKFNHLECLNENEDIIHTNGKDKEGNNFNDNQSGGNSKIWECAKRACDGAEHDQHTTQSHQHLAVNLYKFKSMLFVENSYKRVMNR